MKKSSVLICEAEFLCRAGLRNIIDSHPFYSITGVVSSYEELIAVIDKNKYDIITIDISREGEFGLQSLELIEKQSSVSQIIVVSSDIENRHVYDVLEAGVNCYISKNCNSDEVFKVLECATNKERYYSSIILDIIISQTFGEPIVEAVPLTSREKEIIVFIGNGKTAKEIALVLRIGVHTIYTHRKNIMKKLKFKSPVELITYAINIGLVELK
ncbi:MAG: DNA-binding NarL/FixJ family response regulator [Saprospiraceae bacterium]|jgi:DNA-binding NarL/FixJ family response regulator